MKSGSPLTATGFAALFGAVCACGLAQNTLPGDSPFLPPSRATSNGGPAADDPYELTGTSTSSQGTRICVFDAQAKRSHWIAVGNAYADIQAVSYDPTSDQAVIVVHGSRMTLSMRKAVVSRQAGLAMAPVGIPNAAPPPLQNATLAAPTQGPIHSPPQSAESAKQEREARMLVSDLLEIGMQQRKAYEEAQKRAQQGGKTN